MSAQTRWCARFARGNTIPKGCIGASAIAPEARCTGSSLARLRSPACCARVSGSCSRRVRPCLLGFTPARIFPDTSRQRLTPREQCQRCAADMAMSSRVTLRHGALHPASPRSCAARAHSPRRLSGARYTTRSHKKVRGASFSAARLRTSPAPGRDSLPVHIGEHAPGLHCKVATEIADGVLSDTEGRSAVVDPLRQEDTPQVVVLC